MHDALEQTGREKARAIVWVALSLLFLGYLRWGSEIVSVTSYYRVRRPVLSIWHTFYENLPVGANTVIMNIGFSVAIGIIIIGVILLFWLALDPASETSPEPDIEHPSQ